MDLGTRTPDSIFLDPRMTGMKLLSSSPVGKNNARLSSHGCYDRHCLSWIKKEFQCKLLLLTLKRGTLPLL